MPARVCPDSDTPLSACNGCLGEPKNHVITQKPIADTGSMVYNYTSLTRYNHLIPVGGGV